MPDPAKLFVEFLGFVFPIYSGFPPHLLLPTHVSGFVINLSICTGFKLLENNEITHPCQLLASKAQKI